MFSLPSTINCPTWIGPSCGDSGYMGKRKSKATYAQFDAGHSIALGLMSLTVSEGLPGVMCLSCVVKVTRRGL